MALIWRKKGLFLTYFSQFFSYQGKITKKNLRTYLTHIHTCVLLTLLNFLFCLTNFEKKYEFIRHGFSLVWFLVLILIHTILEQSINNKMLSNYTNAKFIVISKPRTYNDRGEDRHAVQYRNRKKHCFLAAAILIFISKNIITW